MIFKIFSLSKLKVKFALHFILYLPFHNFILKLFVEQMTNILSSNKFRTRGKQEAKL